LKKNALTLALLATSTFLVTPAFAQTQSDQAPETTETASEEGKAIVVTGSRIKRDPNDSPLPLQIISNEDFKREGISSPEQLISFLSTNGNGLDNLASNADVVGGAQRGNNGASSANLRGQGAAGTLVLLNGRRVAAHGLNGGVVDINQIPFSALERVEVLKDGASAIYGTDAIGGVINFITRTDYQGFGTQAFADITQREGGNIYRVSGIAGYGDLQEDGFNVMAAVGYSWNKALRGNQRSFVNTFQPDRGVSVDTRGTPFATFIPLANWLNPVTGVRGPTAYTTGNSPAIPGTTFFASGGINILDLPGQGGCSSVDGQAPYDDVLWAFPQAQFACAWDTGRAAVLQQPLDTLTYLGRAVFRLGDHEISAEVTGSDADSSKRFSNLQLTPNTTTQNYAYSRIAGVNSTVYDDLFNRLQATFPSFAATRGLPISYRWRCIECGPREINTKTKTNRVALGIDGPIADGWDYRAGFSYASSESRSRLGSGYYFRGTTGTGANDVNAPIAPGAVQPGIIGVLNSGFLNPFLLPGQTQSAQGLAMLQAVSAEGVILYGGKYSVRQFDASVSGELFELPGGTVQIAAGVDQREEKYKFNGDARAAAQRPIIIAAPFDDGNALLGVSRTIKAAYAEVLIPLFEGFELTAAARIDDYEGFGSTTNPKVSAKYRPADWLMFRGSYNTGFRAPGFNQIFNGRTEALYTGRGFADPKSCSTPLAPSPTTPGCAVVANVNIINGGQPDLGPETSDQATLGVVFEPSDNFSASLDWWMVNRSGTIQVLTIDQLLTNFDAVQERFIRDASGNLTAIENTWVNAGESKTQGLEVSLRGKVDALGGQLRAGLDGTYLLKKKEKVIPTAAFDDRIGIFTFAGDLGLRWKHSAYIGYSRDKWNISLSQIYRSGYDNQKLPGVASGAINPPRFNEKVSDYFLYNASISYEGLLQGTTITLGVRNLFNTNPPFAITYDSNFGSGSSWEPRVADPRGRSFTVLWDFKF
jgi:iron complex outermembrane recepter protein